MASLTSGFESPGGNTSQADTESLIGTLLGKGFSQAQTQRALLQAQAPSLSQEYRRTQGMQDVGRREAARPLIVKGTKFQNMANYSNVNAIGARAGIIGAQYRLDEAQRRAPVGYTRGQDVDVSVPKYTPYSQGGSEVLTTGRSSMFKSGTYGGGDTGYGNYSHDVSGYNPAITLQQVLNGRLQAVDRGRQNLASAQAAAVQNAANAASQEARAHQFSSVVSAINNPQLLTADVQKIAKMLGVKLGGVPGTKVGNG